MSGRCHEQALAFWVRMLPPSVGGQLLMLLLLALAVTQGLGLVLLTDERNRAVKETGCFGEKPSTTKAVLDARLAVAHRPVTGRMHRDEPHRSFDPEDLDLGRKEVCVQ